MRTNELFTELRKQIDIIDESILDLLSKRLQVSAQIGCLKKDNNLSIVDAKREDVLLEQIINMAKLKKINTEFAINIFKLIIRESIIQQTTSTDIS